MAKEVWEDDLSHVCHLCHCDTGRGSPHLLMYYVTILLQILETCAGHEPSHPLATAWRMTPDQNPGGQTF